MEETAEILRTIQELLSAQKLAVLGTQHGGQPWGSLVAFASTPDLRRLAFATPRSTRKYDYLAKDSRVSMVVDNRENLTRDFYKAMAVTAIGRATEIESHEAQALTALYLNKHPYLQNFLASPSCALVKIRVEKYSLVRRFQEVMEVYLE